MEKKNPPATRAVQYNYNAQARRKEGQSEGHAKKGETDRQTETQRDPGTHFIQ